MTQAIQTAQATKKLQQSLKNIKKDMDKETKALAKQAKAFTRDEFSRLLFKCHNIIRNNDKLSPEAAFDEISKILFIFANFSPFDFNRQAFYG